MRACYLFLLFVPFTQECAPTSSVGTTTIAPNVTSTTPSTSNSTTSTIATSTTTANNCCGWPLEDAPNVNTANPYYMMWDKCSQPVVFNCSISAVSNYTIVGIAVDWPSTPFNLSYVLYPAPGFVTPQQALVASLVCNTEDHLWYINNGTRGYSQFGCAFGMSGSNLFTIS